jgi:hypothetical protein
MPLLTDVKKEWTLQITERQKHNWQQGGTSGNMEQHKKRRSITDWQKQKQPNPTLRQFII